jgi:N-carbamoylputrescine amidase
VETGDPVLLETVVVGIRAVSERGDVGAVGGQAGRYLRAARDGAVAGHHDVDVLDGLAEARIGLPTCWDEWFPEVARAYALQDAEVVVYPTAIGSEPDHPAFDTEPLWEQVIRAQGITNGTFMVVPNRTGAEVRPDGTPGNTFYGSSFVSDPYGRTLVQAPRDEPCVLIADLDLAQRQDWLDLFPFLRTRRPDTYAALTRPVDPEHPYGAP